MKFSKTDTSFEMEFNESNKVLQADFGKVQTVTVTEGVEYYEGKYEAIPTVEGYSLPTKKKYLTEDIGIKAIPVYETTNTAGGSTVYIAKGE